MSLSYGNLLCGDAARPSAVPHLIRPHGEGEKGEGGFASPLPSLSVLYGITSHCRILREITVAATPFVPEVAVNAAGQAPPPLRTTHFSALGSSSSFFRDSLPPQINSDHDPQRTPQLPAVRCGPLVPSSCRTELMRGGGGGAHTWTAIERRSADEPRREGGKGRRELNTVPP